MDRNRPSRLHRGLYLALGLAALGAAGCGAAQEADILAARVASELAVSVRVLEVDASGAILVEADGRYQAKIDAAGELVWAGEDSAKFTVAHGGIYDF